LGRKKANPVERQGSRHPDSGPASRSSLARELYIPALAARRSSLVAPPYWVREPSQRDHRRKPGGLDVPREKAIATGCDEFDVSRRRPHQRRSRTRSALGASPAAIPPTAPPLRSGSRRASGLMEACPGCVEARDFHRPVPSLTSLLSAPTKENLLIIRVTIDSGWHFLGLPSARPHCPQGCRNVVGT
jgi:hypothetical protein